MNFNRTPKKIKGKKPNPIKPLTAYYKNNAFSEKSYLKKVMKLRYSSEPTPPKQKHFDYETYRDSDDEFKITVSVSSAIAKSCYRHARKVLKRALIESKKRKKAKEKADKHASKMAKWAIDWKNVRDYPTYKRDWMLNGGKHKPVETP